MGLVAGHSGELKNKGARGGRRRDCRDRILRQEKSPETANYLGGGGVSKSEI